MSEIDREVAVRRVRALREQSLRDGLWLGCCYIAQALALLLYGYGIISTLLFLAGFVAVPVVIYKVGTRYRDFLRGGYARYLEVTSYLSWTYMASLLVAFLAFYVAFSLLLRDATFIAMMEVSLKLFEEMTKDIEGYKEAMSQMRDLTPLRIAWTVVFNMIVQGLLYIYIVSIFIKRSRPDGGEEK
ncbi:DUF4199 domain-containing protein [uncultured Porphyromonas sp.]|uniref:DUF4199 domain-containing protein n=1 Tax=uncultured Porphyromonas sp. TaxID=159274 RepID=UPI002611F2F2|nr:DUF4199 domain-containing protein [uncultured Porphyromonas sp.]